jgi:beta-phosphoglucomutase-like phosphatase (HAD superfamily)
VATKKPHPEVYLQALHHLGLGPLETLAIEDSPGGVAAARAADVPVIVTRSVYFATATIDAVVAVGPGFDQRKGWHPALVSRTPDQRVTLDDLIDWHQRMDFVSHVA